MTDPSDHGSPAWIKKILGVFLKPRTLEACLGDLEEKFQNRLRSNMPHRKAKLLYMIEALGFLRMASYKDTTVQGLINTLGHTFMFFTRLVRKDPSYYLVSLLGLALSLSSFLFIMMFIRDELAFDKFHQKKDRIFRVTTHLRLSDVDFNQATSQFPAAAALQSELEEVEHAVRVFPQDVDFEWGDKKFEEHVILTDERFLDVFSFPLLLGDVKTALSHPGSVILTQNCAVKYFGPENPMGKNLVLNGHALAVTGVMKDVPEHSHMKFDAIIPLALQLNTWQRETGLEGRENKWYWTGAYTYVLLKQDADAASARARLPLIINKYFPERYKEGGRFELQPLTDIHLKSSLNSELEPGGNILYVQLFSIVAFVIIIVSAINLVNLSWFKISSRVREVGIRKFLGQNAVRIIAQLSIESILVGIPAFLVAVGLCQLFLAPFNLLVQKNLRLWTDPNLLIMAGTLAMIVSVCLIAVIRPAVFYGTRSSSYLLLHKYRSPRTARVRNILMGMQVSFSFVLLVFTFIIGSQIDFFRKKDLGFNKENVIVVDLNEDFYEHLEAFKSELKRSGDVTEVAGGAVPGTVYNGWRFVPEGGSYEKPFLLPLAWCDYNFLTTLNIKLLMGENFNANNRYDSLWPFIINKTAAVELGWLEDPLGREMEVFGPGTTEIMAKGKVIGVIEDYHFESLHRPVKPVVLTVSPGFGTAMIKISDNSFENAITHIAATWKKFSDKPFVYEVLEKKLDKLYANEAKLSHVILFFTFIALYLTCYGMFAMSSLLFSSRLKEVAIRKVFGADQFSISWEFYSRYAAFNLAAIIIGLPIAIFAGNLWLRTFQYRIDLTAPLFLKAGAFILIAGLLSVSYYLVRVAFSSPVRFLRRE